MLATNTSFLAFLAVLFLANPIQAAHHVDFGACWFKNVSILNNNDTNDPLQCFKYDLTGKNRTHTDQIFLNLHGCYQLCGHGFQYYGTSDIAFRLTLFIVPLVTLALRVGWAPVGFANLFWTIVHLLGDPIDSLWSTLTRQEKARRNYHVGLEIAPGAAREVAAVWTAYDQWWQDPVEAFERHLKQRNPRERDRSVGEHYFASRSMTVDESRSPQGDLYRIPDLLSNEEMYYIKHAASELTTNR